MEYKKILPLIDAIYSAAEDPKKWPLTAQKIQQEIGGHSVNLVLEDTQNPKFQYIYTNGVNISDIQFYEQNIIHKDELTDLLEHNKSATPILTQYLLNERKLHQLYPYEEFYKELGFDNFNAALFYKDETRRGWISIVRSIKDPLFKVEEMLILKALIPHLKRAFHINAHMLNAQQCAHASLDSLELLSAAVIFISSKGSVLHYNTKAHPYLLSSDRRKQSIGLNLPDHAANSQLQTLIKAIVHCKNYEHCGVVPFFEKDIRKLALCFPWRSSNQQIDTFGFSTGCIIFILSPSSDAPSEEQLQQAFNLSKAEVRILKGLLNGNSVKHLAESIFITEATVRFHIRSLLRKTESKNQTELLSRVFKLLTVQIR